MPDNVEHPSHYTFSRYEVFDVLMAWFKDDPLLWQVGKYIARAWHKGKILEDLRKARWYLDKAIAREEERASHFVQVKLKVNNEAVGQLDAALKGFSVLARGYKQGYCDNCHVGHCPHNLGVGAVDRRNPFKGPCPDWKEEDQNGEG